MSSEIPLLMPKMSMTMERGELLSWEVDAGAEVSAGDVVAVVQTDKVDMEVEAPVDGTVARFVAEAGSTVDVGEPIAFIATESESLMSGLLDGDTGDTDTTDTDEPTTDTPVSDEPVADARPEPASAGVNGGSSNGHAPQSEVVATPPSRNGPLPAVPKARRRAAELRVLLTDITPSGPNGVITLEDVEQAAQAGSSTTEPAEPAQKPAPASEPAPEPAAKAAEPAPKAAVRKPASDNSGPGFADALEGRRRAVRAAVARTMSRSAAVPQFTAFADLDLERLQQARDGVGWTTVLVRALALALREHPSVLAGWDERAEAPASPPGSCGVALAVDTAVGLLAPVIRDPDRTPVRELDQSVRDTIARARAGKLTMADTEGATTTLSSLGGLGVPSFTSLLTPPQASALSVGSIGPRPVVHQGGLAVRLGVTVGLTVDHRAVDGADAAAVLAELRRLCQQPDALLE